MLDVDDTGDVEPDPYAVDWIPIEDPEIAVERRNRIRVSCAAFFYEIGIEFPGCHQLMDDHMYDALSRQIRPKMETGHPVMDEFFRKKFQAHTGSWIYAHPEMEKLRDLCSWIKASQTNDAPREEFYRYKRLGIKIPLPESGESDTFINKNDTPLL